MSEHAPYRPPHAYTCDRDEMIDRFARVRDMYDESYRRTCSEYESEAARHLNTLIAVAIHRTHPETTHDQLE